MKRGEIGVIGGTGLESILQDAGGFKVGTPYGIIPKVSAGLIEGRRVLYVQRHGEEHQTPPHKVNYRALIWGLKELGVTRVISTNAVGGVDLNLAPGDIVIPHDIVDLTRRRVETFYDGPQVIHVDLTQPYCPELRSLISQAVEKFVERFYPEAVYACTEGPRFETPAEVRALRTLGCQVVGMTNVPEAFLARETEMCYASLCYISNRAAGLQDRLTVDEVVRLGVRMTPLIEGILKTVIPNIPRERTCPCSKALSDSRF